MHKIDLQTIPKTVLPFATNNLSETIVSAIIMRHFGKLSFNFYNNKLEVGAETA